MNPLLFASGSVVGAALAWFVDRGGGSRSALLALNGIACGMFGAVASASGGVDTSAVEAGFGILGTAAPLTLCLTRSRAVAGRAGIPFAIRHFAAALALALVSGTGCATVGFVAVEGVRQISGKERRGIPVGSGFAVSPRPDRSPGAAL